jgi:tryptophan halogenase
MAIIYKKSKFIMKTITIIGGGTAGWLSAIYIKKKYTNYKISIVESSKIGILGAGEGGTPNLKGMLLYNFGFDEEDFLNKVNGTKKYGIIFEGWNDNTSHSFVHGFEASGLEGNTTYSYHFNARLFAEYLKEFALNIGVKYIDNEIKDFELIDNKISKIIFEDLNTIQTDFVIDCSGFKRLIVGNLYKEKWKSYESELIVNSAVPFFLPQHKVDKYPKTIAKAVEYGWIWQIPLQDRWGCGYIYSDKYANETTIVNEINKMFGDKTPTINKSIKFNAGCYENVWVENCIAIGLSGGFLEPLEATSIMTTIVQLKKLPDDIFDYSKRDTYNEFIHNINYQNMMFIRHHYNCSRNDTDFWKEYQNMVLPDQLKDIYDIYNNKKDILGILNIKDKSINFTLPQYMLIHRNNFIQKEKYLI